MLKIFNNWILYILIVWILACQGLFILIQESFGQKIVESLQGQLRQELAISNFSFLARSITDFTVTGAIECGVLTKVTPNHQQIIDLRYMSSKCSINKWLLDGLKLEVKLKSLNGDIYDFEFISKNPSIFYFALWGFRILGGVAILGIAFAMWSISRSEIEVAKRMKALALEVSHDIRSPLSALEMILKSKKFENPEEHKVIMSSLERIKDIANNLLKSEKTHKNRTLCSHLIVPMIESVVFEKRFQFSYIDSLDFKLDFGDDPFLCTNMDEGMFKRVLSNLINNSIEASTNNYQINISLASQDNWIQLSIEDFGVGIPKVILSKIGESGFSSKPHSIDSGNGIGLSSSIAAVKEVGGDLVINSEFGDGTEVIIKLPLVPSPSWLVTAIDLGLYEETWVLDDDLSIHYLWKEKLPSKLRFFSDIKTFRTNVTMNGNGKILYLIDYELGQIQSGIDLIKELSIASSSILVTSFLDLSSLQLEAELCGFKILPKSLMSEVAISARNTDYYDVVYIDDDLILRLGWENQARKKDVKILTLSSVEQFKQHLSVISKELTKIYIDSNLGEYSVRGEDFAILLHEQGYKNLYLATGYDQSCFENHPWLKVLSKECPF